MTGQMSTLFRISPTNDDIPGSLIIGRMEDDIIFPALHAEVAECKCQIDIDENARHWDKAKRRTNPYELVHTMGTNCLSEDPQTTNLVPLSRAFFKMVEIYDSLKIIPDKYADAPGSIAHLAEGPGGFLEGVFAKRKQADDHYAITLQPKNRNIPGWSQLFRRRSHPLHTARVRLQTGDLYQIQTILSFARNFKERRAFLVTCDGGFDYSKDFNNQERNSWRIIFCELTTGMLVQERGGTIICKMFDMFTHLTLQMLFILSSAYREVFIFKPKTSRPANSERYVVARDFKGVSRDLLESMLGVVRSWDDFGSSRVFISNISMPVEFIEEVRQANMRIAQQQMAFVRLTLDHIRGVSQPDTLNALQQTQLAETWFQEHRVIKRQNSETYDDIDNR